MSLPGIDSQIVFLKGRIVHSTDPAIESPINMNPYYKHISCDIGIMKLSLLEHMPISIRGSLDVSLLI